jgi:hypothetical protein
MSNRINHKLTGDVKLYTSYDSIFYLYLPKKKLNVKRKLSYWTEETANFQKQSKFR